MEPSKYRRYDTKEDLQRSVRKWLKVQYGPFSCDGFQKFVYIVSGKCVATEVKCVDKQIKG